MNLNLNSNVPAIAIHDQGQGRTLLSIRIVDGKLSAEFDPEDLTEAAKIFVAEVLKHGNHEL